MGFYQAADKNSPFEAGTGRSAQVRPLAGLLAQSPSPIRRGIFNPLKLF